MSEITHRIFSQDVEVGYIKKYFHYYQIHPLVGTNFYKSIQPILNGKSNVRSSFSFRLCETFADCLNSIPTEFSVIPLSEVVPYLNPLTGDDDTVPLITGLEPELSDSEQLKLIKSDFRKADTEKLNQIFILLDAELKYRARKDAMLQSSGVSNWVNHTEVGHS